jgi:hypothetical protein
MIYILPQLPVRNRYSQDWISIWVRELTKLNTEFLVLGYNYPVKLTYFFTNPDEALKYECNQIKKLVKFKPQKMLCLDIDFPGLITSAIQVLKLTNPELKTFGFLHAGSYNTGDIFEKTKGKKEIEEAMFKVFDKIFVSTNYHKEKIENYFGKKFENLEVVGLPFYKEDVLKYTEPIPFSQKKLILLTGRIEQSDYSFVDTLRREFPSEVFQQLKAKNRREYFNLLNKAKVVISLKKEETFGLTQLETYVLGGIPLSPNKYAYPETIGIKELLYDNTEDLVQKLKYLLTLRENFFRIEIEKYEKVIPKIINEILFCSIS